MSFQSGDSSLTIVCSFAIVTVVAASLSAVHAFRGNHDECKDRSVSRNGHGGGATSGTKAESDEVDLETVQQFLQQSHNKGCDDLVCSVVFQKEAIVPKKEHLEEVVQRLQSRHLSLKAILAVSSNAKKDEKSEKFVLRLPSTGENVRSGRVNVVDCHEQSEQNWKKVIHQALNAHNFPNPTINNPIPLWKLTLVIPSSVPTRTTTAFGEEQPGSQNPALVFTLSHVLFDGTSRNRFLREFIGCLSSVASQYTSSSSGDHDAKSVTNVVPTPIVDLKAIKSHLRSMPWPVFTLQSSEYILRSMWLLIQRTFNNKPRAIPGLSLRNAPGLLDPNVKAETCLYTWSLSSTQTTSLVKKCRSKKTSVHGARTAATHAALLQLARNEIQEQFEHTEHWPERKNICCGSKDNNQQYFFYGSHLVGLWKFLEHVIPENLVTGLLVSFCSIPMTEDEAMDCWALARRIRSATLRFYPLSTSQMKARLALQRICDSWNFVLDPPINYAKLKLLKPGFATSSNGIVNLSSDQYKHNNSNQNDAGSNNFIDYASHVCAIFACSSRHPSPSSCGVLNVQTVNERLHIGWGWYSQIWSEKTAEDFMGYLQNELLTMIQETNQ